MSDHVHEYAGPDDVCWICGDERPDEEDAHAKATLVAAHALVRVEQLEAENRRLRADRPIGITEIENAIWLGATDGAPIPDHWPQWLIGAAMALVPVPPWKGASRNDSLHHRERLRHEPPERRVVLPPVRLVGAVACGLFPSVPSIDTGGRAGMSDRRMVWNREAIERPEFRWVGFRVCGKCGSTWQGILAAETTDHFGPVEETCPGCEMEEAEDD